LFDLKLKLILNDSIRYIPIATQKRAKLNSEWAINYWESKRKLRMAKFGQL